MENRNGLFFGLNSESKCRIVLRDIKTPQKLEKYLNFFQNIMFATWRLIRVRRKIKIWDF